MTQPIPRAPNKAPPQDYNIMGQTFPPPPRAVNAQDEILEAWWSLFRTLRSAKVTISLHDLKHMTVQELINKYAADGVRFCMSYTSQSDSTEAP